MTIKNQSHFSDNLSEWEKRGNLKTMMVLNVTSRGSSLAVIIPRDVVEVNGLVSGDRVRVWLLDHYRRRRRGETT
ncbi:MAG: AbrB/MazE/SpoVT family DNA-binding domain-containing protein [Candidatus Bathyarchaeia archaeon]|jgi:hypothetical protein